MALDRMRDILRDITDGLTTELDRLGSNLADRSSQETKETGKLVSIE